MATRIYAMSPGASFQISSVVENVGPVATSAPIALVVDLSNTVTDGTTSRAVELNELLQAIETFKAYLIANKWPPA